MGTFLRARSLPDYRVWLAVTDLRAYCVELASAALREVVTRLRSRICRVRGTGLLARVLQSYSLLVVTCVASTCSLLCGHSLLMLGRGSGAAYCVVILV